MCEKYFRVYREKIIQCKQKIFFNFLTKNKKKNTKKI